MKLESVDKYEKAQQKEYWNRGMEPGQPSPQATGKQEDKDNIHMCHDL